MRLLFWGTPAYALPSLDALVAAGHSIVGVVSQPDRRRGRGGAAMPSPVKARALELALPVFTPARIRREPELQAELAALGADLSVVVAFGQILPPAVLAQPPLGCWNGHGSLLPRWRGAAPIQWALLEGDAETGVGIMAMEEGLDTGPVLLERRLTIGLLENAAQLGLRLAQLTAELLLEALPLIEAAGVGSEAQRWQRLPLRHQGEVGITQARLLTKPDYQLDWTAAALTLHRRVMGLHPGAHTHWRGQRLRILASEPLLPSLAAQLSSDGARLAAIWGGAACAAVPGTVLACEPGVGLVVATGDGPLLVREGRLEGRRTVGGTALIQQWGGADGDCLGGDPG